jgi:hypothetical protein
LGASKASDPSVSEDEEHALCMFRAILLCSGQDFVSSNGSFALVARYQITVCKEKKMYIGGGLVGTVLVVLLVLFVLGRL